MIRPREEKTPESGAAHTEPFPRSRKVYVEGSRPDLRVPFREISLADTHTRTGVQHNPPLYVYDTSGPYTDPGVEIDVRAGLPALRAARLYAFFW